MSTPKFRVCPDCGHLHDCAALHTTTQIQDATAGLYKALNNAAAALAVVANHAKHPGCADQNNLDSIRGFALESFYQARSIAKLWEN